MAIERRKDNKNRILKDGEYQRSNGTYEYKWSDRRRKRHSIYAPTLAELRKKEDDIKRDALDGIRISEKNLTINDLYELWIKVKRGLKKNTFENYKYMYTQFVQPDFGRTRISNLKRTDVRAFYNTLVDERHLMISTVDSIHNVLHQVLEMAVDDDYLRYNPSDKALKELKKAHNTDSKKHRALTLKEQELFEDYLLTNEQKRRWYHIFTVMLWTGMRVGEIVGLTWGDVNFVEDTISVNHTAVYYADRSSGKTVCTRDVHFPKTKTATREIPMLPKVKKALLDLKELQKKQGIKCNFSIDGYTDFIFLNRFKHLYEQGSLNKALKRIIRDCNYEQLDKNEGKEGILLLPKFSNHSLRHTFTTRMCEAGVNIKAMQAVLGHADAETTLDIYADATKELKTKELISFDEYFSKKKEAQIGA